MNDESAPTNDDDPSRDSNMALRAKLAELKLEHSDLDAAVLALQSAAMPNQIQIARLKKRKLALRDAIAQIEDQYLPDIIA
jgi:hypothetical protein